MQGVCVSPQGLCYRNDLPRPITEGGNQILRVRLAGICDTDLHLARGYMGFRGILGHEFVGEDEAGNRYTSEINFACGSCPSCLQDRTHHCPNRSVLGILKHDGAMADYVCVPEATLHLIPDSVADEIAVFTEPLAAAFRVAEQVGLARRRVAVLGDGKLGLLCAWVARAEGADVTLVGKHDTKLALAGPNIETRRLESLVSPPREFEIVIEATGSPSGLETAMKLVEPQGTIVLKTTMTEPHRLALAPLVIDEIRVVGSRCGPFPRALEALESGSVDVRPLIQATYPLASALDAFAIASTPGARKILLRP